MDTESTIRALSALAQEHRLNAFRALVRAGSGGLSAGEIAQTANIAPSSMSFHLAQLDHAGLVRQRREGRSIIYTAQFGAMAELMAYLTENCCEGESCAATAGASPC